MSSNALRDIFADSAFLSILCDVCQLYLTKIHTNKSPVARCVRRGIVRENMGETTAPSGAHQVMEAL